MSFPPPGRALPWTPGTFRALRHRGFRALWLGQLVSLTGSWMQSVAQGWLVLRLTDSPLMLGVVGFSTYLPVLLFALPAGVLADRVARRRALLWTQAASALVAGILAVLTAAGQVRVEHVAVLAFGLGTATAFDIPIRQSFLQDLVGRDDLQNAIALNSMAFNAARLAGPALAGLILASWGEAACFALNAASYVAVLAGLWTIPPDPPRPAAPGDSWTDGIRQGLAYARSEPRVRTILLLVVVSSIFGMPVTILMPAIARDQLDVGSQGLGFLMGATGAGAVLGALYLAGRTSPRHAGRIVAAAMALFGVALLGFAASRSFSLSLALLVVVGAAMIVQLATSNTFLQLVAPPGLRGRVVSLYTLAFIGMAPFGSLLSGIVARQAGTGVAVGYGGAVCLAAALWFTTRIRRIREAAAA